MIRKLDEEYGPLLTAQSQIVVEMSCLSALDSQNLWELSVLSFNQIQISIALNVSRVERYGDVYTGGRCEGFSSFVQFAKLFPPFLFVCGLQCRHIQTLPRLFFRGSRAVRQESMSSASCRKVSC